MKTAFQVARYSRVPRQELQSGSPRQPQWQAALAEADGDREVAGQIYLAVRVAEILDDENERTTAGDRLQHLRQFNDGLAVNWPGKSLLFFSVFCLTLTVAIYWTLKK